MDLALGGKRALITGGSKGIGLATAQLLAEEGCDLVLSARGEAALEAAAVAIRARHQVRVEIVAADLARRDDVLRVAEFAAAPDILVNNAGAIPPGNLLDVDGERWRAAWDLKVFGFIDLTRALYARMREAGGGVIVNVIGAAGEKFPPDYIAGTAGNAALMAFTRALGHSSAKDGIRVVGINPGATETERLVMLQRDRAARTLGDPERWREMFAAMPFGRAAAPAEIAAAVAFLASPRSGYTSGTILTIDGGG